MKGKSLILSFLFIIVSGFCLGQNLYFQSYASAQGLSQNSIFSIAQTKDGFMWFGTQDGINRFDGKNFIALTPLIENGASKQNVSVKFSKMITALYADKNDWLWFGTTYEIGIYNRYINKFISPADIYKGFAIPGGAWVTQITEDDNNIWIVSKNAGLFCYNKINKIMIPLKWEGTQPEKITAFSYDKNGRVWAGSNKEIYFLEEGIFKPIGLQKKLPQTKNEVVTMTAVGNNVWVILNASKIVIFKKESTAGYAAYNFSTEFQGKKYLTDANTIHQSDPNTVWIGSRSEGLIKINLTTKMFENAGAFGTVNSLKTQFVLSFFTSQQKVTWIGLSGGGIAKYDVQKIQFSLWRNEALPPKPTPDNILLSIYSDNDEDFYLGTLTGGLLHTNIKNGNSRYFIPPSYKYESGDKNIYEIIKGEKNTLWLATWAGLYSFNKVSLSFVQYADTADDQTRQLCSIIQLKNTNRLLTAGYNGSLRIFNLDNHKWEKCNDKKGVLNNKDFKLRVRYMKEMENGDVYMSTEAMSLVRYNYVSGTFTFFPSFQTVSGASRYFSFDGDFLWVATDDGLIQASAKTFDILKLWTTENGLSNNYMYAVLPDNYGRVWVSSNGGLTMVDYKKNICKKFTEDDGLQSMEFNTASCYKDKQGKLWFGGINGLNMVNPELSVENNYSPDPLITNIKVMNIAYKADSATPYIHSLSLPYSKNFISFDFQSPDFSQSENIMYEYQLKGVDTGWVKNGSRNYVSYTQLKPGHYTFMVRSANTNYVWSKNNAYINIEIVPPWYRTNLFYLLSSLLLIGLVFLFFRQRIKNIRYKAESKQKIIETEMAALKAQMNPHFMFNCINSIDAFIHSNDKYNATLYLNKFARLLRNILDSSKQNTVALNKDIETLKLYIELEELRHENKFMTSIVIDPDLINNDYKVPPLIIQPFVENAILHGLKNRETDHGVLDIIIQKAGDRIEYTIRDNGIGRKAAALLSQNKESSYGMQMSNDRIRLFNKEEIPSVAITDLYQNETATGTEVKVSLHIV